MKNVLVRKLVVLGVLGMGLHAIAQNRPEPAEFQAALQACESSSYNVNGVTLPAPTPGERPTFSAEQKSLIDACRNAGILKGHHHRGPKGPPPEEGRGAVQ